MSKPVLHCRVQFNGGRDFTKKFGLEPGGPVQRAIVMSTISNCIDFAPWRTGSLAVSPYIASRFNAGEVIYPGPYAHYQYYGKVRTDENGRVRVGKGESKPVLTNRPLKYTKDYTEKAGPEWFERMKQERTKNILADAKTAAAEAKKGG